jgi:L-arabinokinase
MHGGFATFDTIVDVPFVARHSTRSREEVRATLGLPSDQPLVLPSFGGYGVNGLDLERLDCRIDYGVVVTLESNAAWPQALPAGVHAIRESDLYQSGLRYEDLVAACDVVATKPGYGIISECIANRTAMLYTSRGNFVEYGVLVAEMGRYLRCGFIEQDEVFSGRWLRALDQIMASAPPPERPATNGADVIARSISLMAPAGKLP